MTDDEGKPRLLILTTTFPRWADDHEPAFVFELARRLTDRFKVSVLAPHTSGALDEEHMDGVHVSRFHYAPQRLELLAYDGGIPTKLKRKPWLSMLIPWFLSAQMLAAYRLVRRLRPHVVHAHWLLPSGLVGSLLQELPGADYRLVVTAHGADVHLAGSWVSRLMKREVLAAADLVTVVSKALCDKVAGESPSAKLAVAPMGVDLQHRFVPAPPGSDDQTLVFVGRLVEKKGVADLLNAMPMVVARFPAARLLIAGDGPLADELMTLSSRLSLDAAVTFLGSVANAQLPEVLRRARLAVLPFRIAGDGDQEGLGLVTVEAMGCGIPVIASDLPAVRDVVADGVTGRLSPPGDPQRLAALVIELLEDPSQADRLADMARREAFTRFDWQVVSERYSELLADGIKK